MNIKRAIQWTCVMAVYLAIAWQWAQGQTVRTIAVVGGGSLTYSDRTTTLTCFEDSSQQSYTEDEYFGFSYKTASGATVGLSGGATAISGSSGNGSCPTNGQSPQPLVMSAGIGSSISFVEGSATLVLKGYLNPKWLVVGITYAPPGPSGNTFVQYQKSTFFGTTQSVSQSFTKATTVSMTFGVSIPGVSKGSISSTTSTTNSQTTKKTSTVTTSIQVQSGEKTFGTGNYFAPVDNDYDILWVWLNPVAVFTITGTGAQVWNGYGFDMTDQAGMDIVGIELGYINGHFGAIPPQIQTSLNRTWAASQIWPSGQGPALTSTDLNDIAAFDPFSVGTYGMDEIGFIPPSPETLDHRFTLSQCSSVASFNYNQAAPSQAAPVFTCTLTYTNSSTQAQEISTTYSQTFSVDASFSGTGFLKALNADLKSSTMLTWNTDWQSSITTSTTSTSSLSAQGPPCNNTIQGEGPCVPVYDASGTEPTQFDVYQDNMFGSFMFAPIHYY